MATRTATNNYVSSRQQVMTWTGLLNGDDGSPFSSGLHADKSVQIQGTFGAGGTVVIEGSNVTTPAANSDYVTLNNPQGIALSFTTANLQAILESVRHVRPRVIAGDGTTSLTVNLLVGG